MDQNPTPPNALSASAPSIGEVRDNHRFDEAVLSRWLKANVEDFTGAVEVSSTAAPPTRPS